MPPAPSPPRAVGGRGRRRCQGARIPGPSPQQNVIAEHEIRNISCAAQDPEDLCTFAYITKDLQTGHHYCHVFSTVDVVGSLSARCPGTWWLSPAAVAAPSVHRETAQRTGLVRGSATGRPAPARVSHSLGCPSEAPALQLLRCPLPLMGPAGPSCPFWLRGWAEGTAPAWTGGRTPCALRQFQVLKLVPGRHQAPGLETA